MLRNWVNCENKKGGNVVLVGRCYVRFLSISNPTIAIAATIIAVEIAKYISVGGKDICGISVGCVDASVPNDR
jgi:hypothetical protein